MSYAARDTSLDQMYELSRAVSRYQLDPVGFATDVLGIRTEHIWPKMREICESVRDNQFTIVKAGHSVSKTYTVGRIVVPWFKACFQPSTVITTAPSDNQVRNQLWREIHAAYVSARIPLGGKLNTLAWDMVPAKATLKSMPPEARDLWEKNFAIGFSTTPDTETEHATRMHGWHNEWVLVVLDEGCAIAGSIWRTVLDSLIVNERCKVLAIGNPTDPSGEFYRAAHDPRWNVINISVLDTPNYQSDREVIPGLAGRAYVQQIKDRYGEDSDHYRIRVLGEFPLSKEGTYYGHCLARCRRYERIGDFPHDPRYPVHTFSDFGDIYTATIFVQILPGGVPRIIDDYYDNEGLGAPDWARVLDSRPYIYGHHYAGPDLNTSNRKSFQTGKTTQDVLSSLGKYVQPVIAHAFDDGITAGKTLLPLCQINDQAKTFLDGIGGYCKSKNNRLSTQDKPVYHDQPAATWHRHMADAYRHFAMAWYYMGIEHMVGPAGRFEPVEDKFDPIILSPMAF